MAVRLNPVSKWAAKQAETWLHAQLDAGCAKTQSHVTYYITGVNGSMFALFDVADPTPGWPQAAMGGIETMPRGLAKGTVLVRSVAAYDVFDCRLDPLDAFGRAVTGELVTDDAGLVTGALSPTQETLAKTAGYALVFNVITEENPPNPPFRAYANPCQGWFAMGLGLDGTAVFQETREVLGQAAYACWNRLPPDDRLRIDKGRRAKSIWTYSSDLDA